MEVKRTLALDRFGFGSWADWESWCHDFAERCLCFQLLVFQAQRLFYTGHLDVAGILVTAASNKILSFYYLQAVVM